MSKGWGLFLIVAAVVILGGGWFIKNLNVPVVLDEEVNNAWAQVENQLQRRNDLIPNLVSTVKGYAKHENQTLMEITRLRSQWAKSASITDKIKTANQITAALSKLMVISENYPQLKANQNFLGLQAQLEGAENRIAVERMRYNEAVKRFNAYRRTIWGGFFCRLRGLNQPREYFKAEASAGKVPRVKF